jgi:hypothetical protein
MANTTANSQALIRSEVWSAGLKTILQETLSAEQYVRWLTEFPDGDQFTLPSIGDGLVRNYTENAAVVYDALDTGEFTFTITEYVQSGNYITEKARQDLYYASQLEAAFLPTQARAIKEKLETDIMALAAGGASGGQTVSATNQINGADHRWVSLGTNETMSVADVARALYALKKANVPGTNLVAFVDPSVEYAFNTITNITNFSNNPRWEGIVTTGIASDARFLKNVYGFDIYTSNFLADAGTTGAETIGARSTTVGKCNVFYSAGSPEILPFMGAWRQMPKVDGEYNKDFQREEYVTTARYGLKVFRPENLVVVLTDTDQV